MSSTEPLQKISKFENKMFQPYDQKWGFETVTETIGSKWTDNPIQQIIELLQKAETLFAVRET